MRFSRRVLGKEFPVPAENAPATRAARAEVTRRLVDSSMLEVRVVGTVAYLTGVIRNLRGHPEVDLKHEMEIISHNLRGRAGIREVVWEAQVRT
jgi:hypothetical protein